MRSAASQLAINNTFLMFFIQPTIPVVCSAEIFFLFVAIKLKGLSVETITSAAGDKLHCVPHVETGLSIQYITFSKQRIMSSETLKEQ